MISRMICTGIEVVTLILILRMLLKTERKAGWSEILLVVFTTGSCCVIYGLGVPKLWTYLVYIFPIVYVYRRLCPSFWKTLAAFALAAVFLTVLHLGNYLLLLWMFGDGVSPFAQAVISEILSLCELYPISKKWKKWDVFGALRRNVWGLLWVTFGLGAAVCFWMIGVFKSRLEISNLEIALVVPLLIVTGALIFKAGRNNLELQQKKRELEIYENYDRSYKDLLMLVRKRQHEFRAHLTALYACCYSAESLEELKEMQKRYVSEVKTDNDLNGVLYQMQIPVLAGFFYVKLSEAKEAQIAVEYRFGVEKLGEPLSAFEWIEIFGILLDNAIEAEKELPENQRAIRLCFTEKETGYVCVVENRFRYMVTSELTRCFEENHSSKGANRGLGLPKLKEIVHKYNGTICMQCLEKEESFWIRATVDF